MNSHFDFELGAIIEIVNMNEQKSKIVTHRNEENDGSLITDDVNTSVLETPTIDSGCAVSSSEGSPLLKSHDCYSDTISDL